MRGCLKALLLEKESEKGNERSPQPSLPQKSDNMDLK